MFLVPLEIEHDDLGNEHFRIKSQVQEMICALLQDVFYPSFWNGSLVILLYFESFPFCFEQRECTVSFPRFQGNIQKNSSCWKVKHVGVSEVGISGVKQFPIRSPRSFQESKCKGSQFHVQFHIHCSLNSSIIIIITCRWVCLEVVQTIT